MFGRMLPRVSALRGFRADLAACGAGGVAALALPPVHALPLLLMCVPVLLTLLNAASRPLAAARRGWWFGFGFNVVGLYWITEAILFEAARFWWLVPLAVPALAAVLAAFVAVAAWAARWARPGGHRVLALGGAWVLADLARQFVASGFPWNPLGSVWEFPGLAGDVLIQPAALVGVHGLTLVTVLLAATPVLGWRSRIAGCALLVVWGSWGFVRSAQTQPSAPGLTAVLVQGNIAQGQKWNRALVTEIFDRYLALTADGLARAGDEPAVVIWPETASPFQLETDAPAREAIAQVTGDTPALVGAVRFSPGGRPRNSLFALTAGGRVGSIYDKWHLVPFGEYQPTWAAVGIQLVPGGGFESGPGPRTMHVAGLPPFGVLICYEAIFSAQVVDRSNRPAWLVNVTNDAWFGNSTGPRQHLATARMRAVEEGLPLLRAANTGISAAFDAFGHEVGRLGMEQTGVLVVKLPPALPPPLFAAFGLLIPGVLAVTALGTGLIGRRNSSYG